jgi:hypothetical protein
MPRNPISSSDAANPNRVPSQQPVPEYRIAIAFCQPRRSTFPLGASIRSTVSEPRNIILPASLMPARPMGQF